MPPSVERWNTRYRRKAGDDRPQACALLRDYRHLLPTSGQALDVACGRGGNALLLAAHGLTTSAWDYADVAIDQLHHHASQMSLPINVEVRDVQQQPPAAATFDVIVVSHFLERELAEPLAAALKPQGLLFYQTFIQDKVTDDGPDNTDYRLQPNELLDLFVSLRVVYYREEGRIGDTTQGFRDRAQFIGYRHD